MKDFSNEDLYKQYLIEAQADNDTDAVLVQRVCEAERECQKLLSKLYAYRGPIGKVDFAFK